MAVLTPKNNQPPPIESKPIPSGFGFNREELRRLFVDMHGNSVSKDDPIFMVATLCESLHAEIEKLLEKYKEAYKNVLSKSTNKYIDDVQNITNDFQNLLKQPYVELIQQIFTENAATLQNHTRDMKWCSLIMALSVFFNIIFFVVN
jgi:hypothetical protein